VTGPTATESVNRRGPGAEARGGVPDRGWRSARRSC
jgi:hypothetical protein